MTTSVAAACRIRSDAEACRAWAKMSFRLSESNSSSGTVKCFASDFVSNVGVGNTQPLVVARGRSTTGEVAGDGHGFGGFGQSAAASVGEREVRVVPVGDQRPGDAAGGRRAVEGRPVDGGAHVPGREAGC